jgi:hypothetical protein
MVAEEEHQIRHALERRGCNRARIDAVAPSDGGKCFRIEIVALGDGGKC